LHGDHSYNHHHHIDHHSVEDHAKFTLHGLIGVGCQDAIQQTEEQKGSDPLEDFPALRKLQLGQLVLANVVVHKPFNEEDNEGS